MAFKKPIQFPIWQAWTNNSIGLFKNTEDYPSTEAHWYAFCFGPGGPGFKPWQGRELLILNKREVMMIEIQTIEGGQKRGDQIKK